ncbi:MAG: bifunctional 3'-5' exonuclease/DNA polymerase [Oscillospiraceae bacterium]|jgi:DNA polymerase-1
MDYNMIYTTKEIHDYLGGTGVVAFDFETAPDEQWRDEPKAALDAHKAHIVGISLSIKESSAVYIPLAHKIGTNATDPVDVMEYLRKTVFENPNMVKVAHNLSFEAMFLYALGIVLCEPCYDTIAAAQLTLKSKFEFRNLSDSGLKLLSTSLFGADMSDFATVTAGRLFDEMDPADKETLRYACADSDYTLRLYYKFNDWFAKNLPRHREIVEQVESPTAVYCGMMKYNGVPMNVAVMFERQKEAEEKLVALRADIDEMTGGVDIGANASTSAFKKYLFNDLGLPVLKTTEKHQEAADDATMILLSEYCREKRPELVRLFELVQEYRKWGKLKSTYIDGYLTHINAATGRIHPDLMPLGTQTGRFASRNPNLQNCPRKDNDPVGVRKFITAPEGKLLISLDFSQVELRVGAFYCRDEKMLDTYRTGGDIHAQTTTVIYGIPFSEALDKNAPHYKERRTIAKNCNFGVFYGLFAAGLQKTLRFKAGLNISKQDCEGIISNLKKGYPGLTHWQDETKKRAANTLYAETWLGRRRYIVGILSTDWGKRSFAERCAMNTPIQGTAADIMKLAMGRISRGIKERPWLKPFLQIHDELVFEIPADKLNEAIAFVKSCMEETPFPDFDVPIIAEAAYGANFGDLIEMEGA